MKTKKALHVLCIGDSITKGMVGVNFIKKVQQNFPGSTFVNKGINGETLNKIAERALKHLRENNQYDALIFEAGAGDLAIPTMEHKGSLFQFAYRHQLKIGMKPKTTQEEFYQAYKSAVQEIKQIFSGKIILLTNICIGEDLKTDINKHRAVYNDIIRKIALDEQVLLADAGKSVDQYLANKHQRDYCCPSFWKTTYTDRVWTLTNVGADYLSKQRKLHLTIDGIHLNSQGAAVFAQVIIPLLK